MEEEPSELPDLPLPNLNIDTGPPVGFEVDTEEEPPPVDIITWDQNDFQNLKWAITQIRIIESTHRNLGLPIVFTKFADIANLGFFLCGPRATGKTTAIKAVRKWWNHRDEHLIDFITPKGLKKIQSEFTKNSLTVYNYDFASLSSEYLRDRALGLFSSLIYDHSIRGESMGLSLDVSDCYCSFLSTIQPSLYRVISETRSFESQYKDRFLRYFMLYFRPVFKEQKDKIPTCKEMPHLEKIPKQFPELPETPLEVRELTEYRRLVQALQAQTSKNRGLEYANRLCLASALFNDRTKVTTSDAKFLCLFLPFLNMELFLSERESASEPLKFNADAYHIFDYICTYGEAQPGTLEKRFQLRKYKGYSHNPGKFISKTRMKDDITVLRSKDMIKGKWSMKGVKAYYAVHHDWQQWYRLPVLKFLEYIKA